MLKPINALENKSARMRARRAGASAQYGSSQIPATEILCQGCSLLVAADGSTGAKLASNIGGGFIFGGGLEGQLVRDRISMGIRNSEQKAWVVPAVSLATTRDEVIAETCAQIVAIVNRALRDNLIPLLRLRLHQRN